MLTYIQGDIVAAQADIVVNAANGFGWMGGILSRKIKLHGIAEAINYATNGKIEKEIKAARKIYWPGEVFFTNGYGIGKIGMIHAVTMLIPGWRTKEKTVRKLLPRIVELAVEKGAKTIAIPWLGCGTGQLKVERVRKIYEEYFETISSLEVTIYYL